MSEKIFSFIIDVAPLTPLSPSGRQTYSYLHSEPLSVGTLVLVSFFRREIQGIVSGSRTDFHRFGGIKLKKISAVLEKDLLTPKQLALADFISAYYLTSLGTTLKFFIPKKVKERNPQTLSLQKNPPKIFLTAEQKKAVEKISTRKKSDLQKFLLFGPANSGKTEIYIHSILALRAKNPTAQFLILLPELTLAPQALEKYARHFSSEETVLVHSKLNKGRLFSTWEKIKSGKAKLIIGSRMALFSPFLKLSLVTVDEEQDIAYKQWDMQPRYDTRLVAEKLAEIHQCPLVFGSAAPRLETYYRASEKKDLFLLTLSRLRLIDKKIRTVSEKIAPLEVVDMKKERWKKNYSLISQRLQSEITWTLKNKFQTILFVNRRGESAFSVCSKCKQVFKCPCCDRALIYEKDIYKCPHCSHKTDIFPTCPHCGGNYFKTYGATAGKTEKEIKKIFPEAKIARFDAETGKAAKAREKIYRLFMKKKIDILIGTQMIAFGWDLPNVALVGIIDADGLLSFPDYPTDERAFQNILQAAGRTGRTNSNFTGKAIVQTFNPEKNFFKEIIAGDYQAFYQREVEERKLLSYPPFTGIIKLLFRHEKKSETEKEAQKIFSVLLKIIGSNPLLSISQPLDPMLSKIRGRFGKMLILKIKKGSLENHPSLKKELSKLKKGWTVDIDPIGAA